MLIPSIDLQNGRIVQLVQGERLAIETDDLDTWIARFKPFRKVQLIDLDAAMARGNNDALVRRIAAELPCRVGGGVRTVGRAEQLLAAGAQAVIAGSGLFRGPGQWTAADVAVDRGVVINQDFARALPATVGPAARDRRRRREGRPRRHSRLEDRAPHQARLRPCTALEAVLRRVPLHARGQGGPDAGHRHGRHPLRPRARRQGA